MRRLLIVLALALSAAGMCGLQLLDPGVGPMEQPLSAHGLGAHALLWSVSVALAGLAMLAESWPWYRRSPGNHGAVFLGFSGVSLLIVAVFTTDPWYPWQHMLSPTGWMHVFGTGGSMGGLWLAMLFWMRSPNGVEGSAFRVVTRLFAAAYLLLLSVVLVATVVFIILGKPVPLIGLEERVLLFLALGWLILTAG